MAKKSAGTVTIDFGKEEDSGGGKRINWPEGDYHVKITKAKYVRSGDKDTPGLELTFKVLEGKKKGKEFNDTLWITPKSLVRIRLLLEALGKKVPKSAVNLKLKSLIGGELWVELETESRDGYDDRSRVAFRGFTSEEEYEESDDDEDEDDDDEEDDEDEEDEDEDDDEDDEDEDEDEEPVKKKGTKKPAKKPAKKSKSKKGKKSKSDDDDLEELDLDEL
jgi:hypothetical protein